MIYQLNINDHVVSRMYFELLKEEFEKTNTTMFKYIIGPTIMHPYLILEQASKYNWSLDCLTFTSKDIELLNFPEFRNKIIEHLDNIT